MSSSAPSIQSKRSSQSGLLTGTGDPLQQVKLLAALRSGDPALIHPFLSEFSKERRTSTDGEANVGAAALHLAIRCASHDTVALLLDNRSISPNARHPPGSGTTALHLAASIGRPDIVKLLLEQQGIDDTLRDAQGKTCLDVARGKDVLRAIHESRSFLFASYRSLLHAYLSSPSTSSPSPALLELLESPRIRLVNLSHLDDATGTTLLHEAVRRKDLRLVELAVRAGADVFVRDRRGKSVSDAAGKDDKVKVFLRQFTNHDTTLLDNGTSSADPPTLKGYLNKYTNVARGYNTRWFVLRNGVLSYYRYQEDESVASRGSIAMKIAILRVAPGGDKLRFEVHSTPSRGHTGIQKWYMKANHPVEATRWTQAITRSIAWHKKAESEYDSSASRKSMDSDRAPALSPGIPAQSPAMSPTIRSRTLSSFPTRALSSTFTRRRQETSMSGASSIHDDGPNHSGVSLSDVDAGPPIVRGATSFADDEMGETSDEADMAGISAPPYDDTFDLQGNSATAQLELTSQLVNSLSASLPPSSTSPATLEIKQALADALKGAQGMLVEYAQMARARDEWWRVALEKERQRQSVWEQSLQIVVKEGQELEQELRTRSRRRTSRLVDSAILVGADAGTYRGKPTGLPVTEETPTAEVPPPIAIAPVPMSTSTSASTSGLPLSIDPLPSSPSGFTLRQSTPGMPQSPDAQEVDTDEEDEFFDAIEANSIPNLVVNEALTAHGQGESNSLPLFKSRQYVGYEALRTRLSMDEDTRPSTSLWQVLKGSIGKDLTRISFPVYFNEPTSMLQRMAEDMEFSETLDAAANERDPLRRIAFVAAFAMSNYSSTIGRIAKPFNPMLSETFEYVRVDKEYRYVSEQVSHHPPMSACWAESPRWHYYGEVDAQNKFMGKSFEIRPTGIAHADLLLPVEWGPDYPKGTNVSGEERAVEHYTWKKVTTSVSGFILGNPTIDHYGDMVVTNRRTGDTCTLTFKPRGWRGKDAFEISGFVQDADGRTMYEIAGRWNSQLIARAAGGSGYLSPDHATNGPASPSAPEYILLWRNSEKPKAPFNLTPFALTLNDCPTDTLMPYLCPTDCRLRPDQRAFEDGQYERANGLKIAQEEKQRATRRAREEGRAPAHKPRWFSAQTDGDTGERVWLPERTGAEEGRGESIAYWAERERVWKAGGNVPWTGVEGIFVEDG